MSKKGCLASLGPVSFQNLMSLSEFHQDVAMDKAEGRRMVASWAYDQGKIDGAMAILRTIDFGQNQSNDSDEEEETEA